MGTDAASEYATVIGPAAGDTVEPAKRRAERAVRVAKVLGKLATAPIACSGKRAAWHLTRTVVAHALDFDDSVLSQASMVEYAARVEEAVWETLELSVNHGLTDTQKMQAALPTCMSGLQVNRPTALPGVARAATVVQNGPEVRRAIAEQLTQAGDARVPRELDGLEDGRHCARHCR